MTINNQRQKMATLYFFYNHYSLLQTPQIALLPVAFKVTGSLLFLFQNFGQLHPTANRNKTSKPTCV